MFKNKTIIVTGGTGTLGNAVTERLLKLKAAKVIIYSRDELKQLHMWEKFRNDRLRFFIGDIRDIGRLKQAFRGVDYVIHAAALKQVPACEYNPIEAIKTNVLGAKNVVEAALHNKVKKVIALSTDKACSPINLYGATKLCSDKLFIQANNLSPFKNRTIFSIVRYGNVAGSRGSVIPVFEEMLKNNCESLPLTHEDMTRFYITTDQAVELILTAFEKMNGGEIFVAKIPSFKIIDLIKNYFKKDYHIIGIRPGEKIHEVMISAEDSFETYEQKKYFIIYPASHLWVDDNKMKKIGSKVKPGFIYSSGENEKWLFQ